MSNLDKAFKRLEVIREEVRLIKDRFVYVLRYIALAALTPERRVMGDRSISVHYIELTFKHLFEKLKETYEHYIKQALKPITDLPQSEKWTVIGGNPVAFDRLTDANRAFSDLERVIEIFKETLLFPSVFESVVKRGWSMLESFDMNTDLFISCLRIAASTPTEPIAYLCAAADMPGEAKKTPNGVNVEAVLQIIAITQGWPILGRFNDSVVELEEFIPMHHFLNLWSRKAVESMLSNFIFYEYIFENLIYDDEDHS